MTSSIKASKKPTKYTKNPGSLKRMKIFDYGLKLSLSEFNTLPDIFFISPEPYRKVRKFTMN